MILDWASKNPLFPVLFWIYSDIAFISAGTDKYFAADFQATADLGVSLSRDRSFAINAICTSDIVVSVLRDRGYAINFNATSDMLVALTVIHPSVGGANIILLMGAI